jgi:hypothetical protein
MPPFDVPQLCTSVGRPPSGDDWIHKIKFDGYRIQVRIQNGQVTLKTGLDVEVRRGKVPHRIRVFYRPLRAAETRLPADTNAAVALGASAFCSSGFSLVQARSLALRR